MLGRERSMKKSKNRENLYLFDREYNNSEIFSVDDHVDINRCHELYENPFLYNRNNANIIADSIEDFAVNYQDCNIYFGSFVRSSLIPLKEKKKYNRIFAPYQAVPWGKFLVDIYYFPYFSLIALKNVDPFTEVAPFSMSSKLAFIKVAACILANISS